MYNATGRCLDVERGFISFDSKQELSLLDAFSVSSVPLQDCAFGHCLTEFGHQDGSISRSRKTFSRQGLSPPYKWYQPRELHDRQVAAQSAVAHQESPVV